MWLDIFSRASSKRLSPQECEIPLARGESLRGFTLNNSARQSSGWRHQSTKHFEYASRRHDATRGLCGEGTFVAEFSSLLESRCRARFAKGLPNYAENEVPRFKRRATLAWLKGEGISIDTR